MQKYMILPYTRFSKSVKALALALGNTKAIKVDGTSNFKPSNKSIIINWGNRSAQARQYSGSSAIMLNKPHVLDLCNNKTRFFQAMEEANVPIPRFTTDGEEAYSWYEEGSEVVGRATVKGHSGVGIYFASDIGEAISLEDWKEFPLYTEYVKKISEFRVHVFRGNVIDIQQKRLRTTDDNNNPVNKKDVDFRVRSHAKGFVFCKHKVDDIPVVQEVALQSFNAIKNLDFGAFDIIYNRSQNSAYVLECNTAPGLEGSTVDNYVRAIKELV